MSASRAGICRPGAILCLAILVVFHSTHAAPVYEQDTTQVAEYDGGANGCYYNFQHYQEGDRIVTNEPCLNCTCHNRMLMCYLRVCPFTKAIGQDCTVEKRPDQCCPVITCPEVPVQLLTSTTNAPATAGSTEIGAHDNYGCSVDSKFYADGAQIPADPHNPCELCYCIRNRTACVMQECTLRVAGCRPVYQPGVCCPVKYNCDYDEEMETTVGPTPGLIMTTTVAPGIGAPQCYHEGRAYDDGESVYSPQACEHCYCFHGDIVCAVQDCGTPLKTQGKNCTALPAPKGKCCPTTYECEGESQPLNIFESDEEQSYDNQQNQVPLELIPGQSPDETDVQATQATDVNQEDEDDSQQTQKVHDTFPGADNAIPEKHGDEIEGITEATVEYIPVSESGEIPQTVAPVEENAVPEYKLTDVSTGVKDSIPSEEHLTEGPVAEEKPESEINPTKSVDSEAVDTDKNLTDEQTVVKETEEPIIVKETEGNPTDATIDEENPKISVEQEQQPTEISIAEDQVTEVSGKERPTEKSTSAEEPTQTPILGDNKIQTDATLTEENPSLVEHPIDGHVSVEGHPTDGATLVDEHHPTDAMIPAEEQNPEPENVDKQPVEPSDEVHQTERIIPTKEQAPTESTIIEENSAKPFSEEQPTEVIIPAEEQTPTESTIIEENSVKPFGEEHPTGGIIPTEEQTPTESTIIEENPVKPFGEEHPSEEIIPAEKQTPTESTIIGENTIKPFDEEHPTEVIIPAEEQTPTELTIIEENPVKTLSVQHPSESIIPAEEQTPTESTIIEENSVKPFGEEHPTEGIIPTEEQTPTESIMIAEKPVEPFGAEHPSEEIIPVDAQKPTNSRIDEGKPGEESNEKPVTAEPNVVYDHDEHPIKSTITEEKPGASAIEEQEPTDASVNTEEQKPTGSTGIFDENYKPTESSVSDEEQMITQAIITEEKPIEEIIPEERPTHITEQKPDDEQVPTGATIGEDRLGEDRPVEGSGEPPVELTDVPISSDEHVTEAVIIEGALPEGSGNSIMEPVIPEKDIETPDHPIESSSDEYKPIEGSIAGEEHKPVESHSAEAPIDEEKPTEESVGDGVEPTLITDESPVKEFDEEKPTEVQSSGEVHPTEYSIVEEKPTEKIIDGDQHSTETSISGEKPLEESTGPISSDDKPIEIPIESEKPVETSVPSDEHLSTKIAEGKPSEGPIVSEEHSTEAVIPVREPTGGLVDMQLPIQPAIIVGQQSANPIEQPSQGPSGIPIPDRVPVHKAEDEDAINEIHVTEGYFENRQPGMHIPDNLMTDDHVQTHTPLAQPTAGDAAATLDEGQVPVIHDHTVVPIVQSYTPLEGHIPIGHDGSVIEDKLPTADDQITQDGEALTTPGTNIQNISENETPHTSEQSIANEEQTDTPISEDKPLREHITDGEHPTKDLIDQETLPGSSVELPEVPSITGEDKLSEGPVGEEEVTSTEAAVYEQKPTEISADQNTSEGPIAAEKVTPTEATVSGQNPDEGSADVIIVASEEELPTKGPVHEGESVPAENTLDDDQHKQVIITDEPSTGSIVPVEEHPTDISITDEKPTEGVILEKPAGSPISGEELTSNVPELPVGIEEEVTGHPIVKEQPVEGSVEQPTENPVDEQEPTDELSIELHPIQDTISEEKPTGTSVEGEKPTEGTLLVEVHPTEVSVNEKEPSIEGKPTDETVHEGDQTETPIHEQKPAVAPIFDDSGESETSTKIAEVKPEQTEESVDLQEHQTEASTYEEKPTETFIPAGKPGADEVEQTQVPLTEEHPTEASALDEKPNEVQQTESPVEEVKPPSEPSVTVGIPTEEAGETPTDASVSEEEAKPTKSAIDEKNVAEDEKQETQGPVLGEHLPTKPSISEAKPTQVSIADEKPTEASIVDDKPIGASIPEEKPTDIPSAGEASTELANAGETLVIGGEEHTQNEKSPTESVGETEAIVPISVGTPTELPIAEENPTEHSISEKPVEGDEQQTESSVAIDKLPTEASSVDEKPTVESVAGEKPTEVPGVEDKTSDGEKSQTLTPITDQKLSTEDSIAEKQPSESPITEDKPTAGEEITIEEHQPVEHHEFVASEGVSNQETIEHSTEQSTEVVIDQAHDIQAPEVGKPEPYGPQSIPGEGNCLVDGQSYSNNSAIPPANACQLQCRCVSSIVQCDLVECLPPPAHLSNCMPVHTGSDSCCPVYACDSTPTVELESDSQLTENHTPGYGEENPELQTGEPLTPERPVDEQSAKPTKSVDEQPPSPISPIDEHISAPITPIGGQPAGSGTIVEEPVEHVTGSKSPVDVQTQVPVEVGEPENDIAPIDEQTTRPIISVDQTTEPLPSHAQTTSSVEQTEEHTIAPISPVEQSEEQTIRPVLSVEEETPGPVISTEPAEEQTVGPVTLDKQTTESIEISEEQTAVPITSVETQTSEATITSDEQTGGSTITVDEQTIGPVRTVEEQQTIGTIEKESDAPVVPTEGQVDSVKILETHVTSDGDQQNVKPEKAVMVHITEPVEEQTAGPVESIEQQQTVEPVDEQQTVNPVEQQNGAPLVPVEEQTELGEHPEKDTTPSEEHGTAVPTVGDEISTTDEDHNIIPQEQAPVTHDIHVPIGSDETVTESKHPVTEEAITHDGEAVTAPGIHIQHIPQDETPDANVKPIVPEEPQTDTPIAEVKPTEAADEAHPTKGSIDEETSSASSTDIPHLPSVTGEHESTEGSISAEEATSTVTVVPEEKPAEESADQNPTEGPIGGEKATPTKAAVSEEKPAEGSGGQGPSEVPIVDDNVTPTEATVSEQNPDEESDNVKPIQESISVKTPTEVPITDEKPIEVQVPSEEAITKASVTEKPTESSITEEKPTETTAFDEKTTGIEEHPTEIPVIIEELSTSGPIYESESVPEENALDHDQQTQLPITEEPSTGGTIPVEDHPTDVSIADEKPTEGVILEKPAETPVSGEELTSNVPELPVGSEEQVTGHPIDKEQPLEGSVEQPIEESVAEHKPTDELSIKVHPSQGPVSEEKPTEADVDEEKPTEGTLIVEVHQTEVSINEKEPSIEGKPTDETVHEGDQTETPIHEQKPAVAPIFDDSGESETSTKIAEVQPEQTEETVDLQEHQTEASTYEENPIVTSVLTGKPSADEVEQTQVPLTEEHPTEASALDEKPNEVQQTESPVEEVKPPSEPSVTVGIPTEEAGETPTDASVSEEETEPTKSAIDEKNVAEDEKQETQGPVVGEHLSSEQSTTEEKPAQVPIADEKPTEASVADNKPIGAFIPEEKPTDIPIAGEASTELANSDETLVIGEEEQTQDEKFPTKSSVGETEAIVPIPEGTSTELPVAEEHPTEHSISEKPIEGDEQQTESPIAIEKLPTEASSVDEKPESVAEKKPTEVSLPEVHETTVTPILLPTDTSISHEDEEQPAVPSITEKTSSEGPITHEVHTTETPVSEEKQTTIAAEKHQSSTAVIEAKPDEAQSTEASVSEELGGKSTVSPIAPEEHSTVISISEKEPISEGLPTKSVVPDHVSTVETLPTEISIVQPTGKPEEKLTEGPIIPEEQPTESTSAAEKPIDGEQTEHATQEQTVDQHVTKESLPTEPVVIGASEESSEDEDQKQHVEEPNLFGQVTENPAFPEDHDDSEGQLIVRPDDQHFQPANHSNDDTKRPVKPGYFGHPITSTLAPQGSLQYPDHAVSGEDNGHFPINSGSVLNPDASDGDDYDEDDQAIYGPGTCRYGGKVYVSAQQIPRDDPCDFCFCFRSDIICLQQSCPPPIPGCHEEPINGFCCPRYECPVSMATSLNVTTTTTTTTTTLPPHFLSHAYKGAARRSGCQIRGQAYQVGEVIQSASGPCLHCTCGGDGNMKCEPRVCSPEPMLRQMIAAATARRRR